MSDFIELLKDESEDIEREFKKASLKGKGTPQEVADFREGYFQAFLARYFPFPYRIAKGGIIDSFGQKSDSIDCIICNPIHPHTIENSNKFSIILADGVDCAIEIKPDITNKKELERGLEQARSVKKLRRVESSIFPSIKNPPTHNEIEFSKTISSVIFTLKAKKDIAKTTQDIINYYKENDIKLDEQFDAIIINNRGIIKNYKYPELNKHMVPEEQKTGYYWEEWNELTLAGLLLYLNIGIFPASPIIVHNPLYHYIKNVEIKMSRWDN